MDKTDKIEVFKAQIMNTKAQPMNTWLKIFIKTDKRILLVVQNTGLDIKLGWVHHLGLKQDKPCHLFMINNLPKKVSLSGQVQDTIKKISKRI